LRQVAPATPRVLPIDRLMAGYNLVLAGIWSLYLGRASFAPWILLAHLAGATLPILWRRAPDPLSLPLRAIRDLYPLIWLGALWSELALLHLVRVAPPADAAIAALDLAVFGSHLNETWLPGTTSLLLSETLHFSYWAYYLLIGIPPLVLALTRRTEALRDLVFRVMLVYLTCYLVFIIAPVYGPRETAMRYTGPLAEGFFYQLVHHTVNFGESPGCSFPSSHAAAAVAIALMGWRYFSRPVGILLFIEAVGVALGTFFTQNHYAIDALAGFIWGVVFTVIVAPPVMRWLGDRPRPGVRRLDPDLSPAPELER